MADLGDVSAVREEELLERCAGAGHPREPGTDRCYCGEKDR